MPLLLNPGHPDVLIHANQLWNSGMALALVVTNMEAVEHGTRIIQLIVFKSVVTSNHFVQYLFIEYSHKNEEILFIPRINALE